MMATGGPDGRSQDGGGGESDAPRTFASSRDNGLENILTELNHWTAAHMSVDGESINEESSCLFHLQSSSFETSGISLSFLLSGQYRFSLQCPFGYPNHTEHFYIPEADKNIKLWANALNEYLLDAPHMLSLSQILDKASSIHWNDRRESTSNSEDECECNMDEDEEAETEMPALSGDELFTTEWELTAARKKKRWATKEKEVREKLKAKVGPSGAEANAFHLTGQEKDQAKQIFTSSAASGILTNDLLKILEKHKQGGFTADAVDDNIYQWCIRLFDFQPDSGLHSDLMILQEKFGYNFIELQLDFAIDLYPFYPPLVKVIRPRLQGSMMQRVTNMEMLKLSYWNPAKDMRSILLDIKQFLQQWARLQVDSERNDPKRYPYGSYVDIEHHLLRLALVSEVNPRANFKYHIDVERLPAMKPSTSLKSLMLSSPADVANHDDHYYAKDQKRRDEYWAAGVGFGHHNRPEWDIRAYVAAQKEKDKQIESVLHKILHELKVLYANHAPQLKPRSSHHMAHGCAAAGLKDGGSSSGVGSNSSGCTSGSSSNSSSEHLMVCVGVEEGSDGCVVNMDQSDCIVDPVADVYNILEGSALVPFTEQYLKTDSFLEICRHTAVYRVIVDIIKEIALQPQLVPLLGRLTNQQESVYQHLSNLEQKANTLLHHICKAGNGCIPKPPKREGHTASKRSKERTNSPQEHPHMPGGDSHGAATAEEKLAREFQSLFKDVSEAFRRLNIDPHRPAESENHLTDGHGNDVAHVEPPQEVMDISIVSDQHILEGKYKMVMGDLQFQACTFDVDAPNSHHFAKVFKKQEALSQAQIFRIAQELTSLAISLPLNLCSAIFLRTDDDKLTLMKALITGPEDTPYSGGCFQFDIFFPSGYPKVPPMVNLQTTGSGTVRFNPNLYNCGKVCLSLLGTWDGQQGEQWNETTSTILQVLVSIQSLILVPEPYFNEPGYEQEIGTEAGDKHSAEYNLDIRINTIKHAMIGQLQNPSTGFEDVIRAHFFLKKERLLEEVEEWMRTSKSTKLERAVQNLRSELHKLEPPPKLVNLLNTPSAAATATVTLATLQIPS